MLTKLIIFLVVFFIIIQLFKKSSEVVGNWSHLFTGMKHSPEEFYNLIKEILTEQKVPDVSTASRNLKQGGMLSNQREYFLVRRGEYTFHICAAPWGENFFFSWWLRKDLNTLDAILIKIPYIGPRIVESRQYESYYKLDTDTMFRTSVHQAVQEAIDRLTESKGIRGLTELERKPELKSMIK